MTLTLAKLRADQSEVIRHPAKYKFICAGRRFGKTFMCVEVAMAAMHYGARIAWIVPTLKNARAMWRATERKSLQIPKSQIIIKSRSERLLQLSNGGSIAVFSDNNGNSDGVLGDAFHFVVLDEAARIRSETYYDVVIPTLADYDGDLIAISTPKGRNWFYDEYTKGMDSNDKLQQSFHVRTDANPMPGIQKAFKLARDRLPESAFRENWLAEFIDSAGLVFRNVHNVCRLPMREYYSGHFAFGVDWGRYNDYTVISIMDMRTKQQVYLDRFNQIGWELQRGRLMSLYEQWQPKIIIAESNSMGEPNIEALEAEGLPIVPFYTSAASKGPLIEAYSLAIENEDVTLLDDTIQKSELLGYGMERLPSGHWRYNAPPGKHDDTVIAGSLSWHGCNQPETGWDDTDYDENWRGT